MTTVIVVGTQWGDEGKGKIIDLLTDRASHVVRPQGGNNAGHTIKVGDEEYKLHLIPSGILHDHTNCYLGAGVVIDPQVLLQELDMLRSRGIRTIGRLWISPAAHIIFPYHRQLDRLLESKKGKRSVGTTGRGIGPCYADKVHRIGIRAGELVRPDIFREVLAIRVELLNQELEALHSEKPLIFEELYQEYHQYGEALRSFVVPTEKKISEAITNGDNVLLEGAQGTFLDTSSGTYPFVTSSNTIAGGLCAGAGVGPTRINHTIGVLKAYTTRVGHGPLPTQLPEGKDFLNHQQAREFGTTTGRKRRIGWFDGVLARQAAELNGLDSIALTKLDVLDQADQLQMCVGYKLRGKVIDHVPAVVQDLEQLIPIYETLPGWQCDTKEITTFEKLPKNAKQYIAFIEKFCQTPISIVSLGPERSRTIILNHPFTEQETTA